MLKARKMASHRWLVVSYSTCLQWSGRKIEMGWLSTKWVVTGLVCLLLVLKPEPCTVVYTAGSWLFLFALSFYSE
jgi:hypothetical protein